MLGEAFLFLQRDEDWLRTVAVGGLLTLAAPLLVPLFPLQGYLARVLRRSATGGREPPAFDDWRSLFVEGARLLAVQVGYLLIPAVFMAVGLVAASAGTLGLVGQGGGQLIEIGGLAVAASGGVLLGMALFLLPAGMAHFAREQEVNAAFDVVVVLRAAFQPEYVSAFVTAVLVGAFLGTVALVLTLLLVGPFVLFYVQVSIVYLFGRGYVAGRDLEGASAPVQPGPPT